MKNLYQSVLAVLLLCSFSAFAQVPVYSSYPSAPATIFLDFDGQTVSGSSWNTTGPIYCGASGLTTSQITEIYNRVAEDYRPFNVNITTDSTKYFSTPANRRMRVILTVTSEWYGSAGGVAFTGSFTWGDNTPAFVFTALLGYNAKFIGEAAAHEAGHTLGLRHQAAYDNTCVKTSDYNYGVGSGEIGWAPIMGAGYYQNFTLWNNGANPYGCTNYQNDLAIITTNLPYRTDDYGSTISSTKTTEVNFTNDRFTLSGMIEQSSDVDAIKFTMPADGRFQLSANPFNIGSGNVGANLDMQVELMTSATTVIGTYNPDNSLGASIDTNLNAGVYYLRVQAKGNAYAPQYASLGSYELDATISSISGVLPVRKIELKGVNKSNKHELSWAINADELVAKQVLETSVNGRSFGLISEPSNSVRQFNYISTNTSVTYYRLKVEFSNGSEYYSNIVAMPVSTSARPSLNGNLVRNSVSVTCASNYSYLITDYSGRIVSRGKIMQGVNTIDAANLSNGMYIIQFNNGGDQFVEKFMKQ